MISGKQILSFIIMIVLLSGTCRLNSLFASAGNGSEGSEAPQVYTVTGKVTSATDNSPLPGVSIIVKGTVKGTISNSDGSFNIEVSGSDAILVFSFVGLQTTEVPVSGRKVVDVSMTGTFLSLDEVVVTALGISRKEKSLGYSVGKVQGRCPG